MYNKHEIEEHQLEAAVELYELDKVFDNKNIVENCVDYLKNIAQNYVTNNLSQFTLNLFDK